MSLGALILLLVPTLTTLLAAQCAGRIVKEGLTTLAVVIAITLFLALLQTSWVEEVIGGFSAPASPQIVAVRALLAPLVAGSVVTSLAVSVVDRSVGPVAGKALNAARPLILAGFLVLGFSSYTEPLTSFFLSR
jgi:hypothetical protein